MACDTCLNELVTLLQTVLALLQLTCNYLIGGIENNNFEGCPILFSTLTCNSLIGRELAERNFGVDYSANRIILLVKRETNDISMKECW